MTFTHTVKRGNQKLLPYEQFLPHKKDFCWYKCMHLGRFSDAKHYLVTRTKPLKVTIFSVQIKIRDAIKPVLKSHFSTFDHLAKTIIIHLQ